MQQLFIYTPYGLLLNIANKNVKNNEKAKFLINTPKQTMCWRGKKLSQNQKRTKKKLTK